MDGWGFDTPSLLHQFAPYIGAKNEASVHAYKVTHVAGELGT